MNLWAPGQVYADRDGSSVRVAAAHLVLAADRISPLRSKGSFGLCEARARRLKRRALDTLRTTMAAHVDLRVHFDEEEPAGGISQT